jgi:predicted phosphate transport protein (TIGR00153 family)
MLIRSTSPLTKLLRKSPFKPIQEHMRAVFSCICVLPPLFEALFNQERNTVVECADNICKLETEADKIKSTFRLNMPKSLLLPVDRKDLLSLMADQDSMADTCEEIGKVLTYRDMVVPTALKALLDELLEGTMEVSAEAKAMIEELDELVEVGFGGVRELEKITTIISGVRKSEHNIDNILHRTKQALFSIEGDLPPVDVMFWYKIIELLGDISNQAENIADRLLLFLSR